jgi:hypothetical protein
VAQTVGNVEVGGGKQTRENPIEAILKRHERRVLDNIGRELVTVRNSDK